MFWKSVQETKDWLLFVIIFYAILPDHFHWFLMLPEEQPNFSWVMQHEPAQCPICG